jgi:predicted acylesterase/phospholipase RssA
MAGRADIEAVEVGGYLYVDGGIIDLLPAEPILRDGGFDHVFGVNFVLPPQLEPEDITGWNDRPIGVLTASRQAEQASSSNSRAAPGARSATA